MAGKNPAWMHYPNDWIKDLGQHPAEIGGYWMFILCDLHWTDGVGTKTLAQWAKVLRISGFKTKRILNYLREETIADIELISNPKLKYKITSRRMVRDAKKREEERLRKEEERKKSNDVRDLSDGCPDSVRDLSDPSSITFPITVTNKNNIPPNPPQGDRVPYQKIVDIYHEELPSLASVRVVGDALKKSIRARCREAKERLAPEWWSNFFRSEVSPSDWLMGRTKDWEANLAWIVTRSKFEKIVNGGYRNKKVKQHPAGRHPGDCGAESQEEPKNTRGSTQAREAISEAIRKVASSTGQI